MSTKYDEYKNNDIDLKEMFLVLWHFKILIFITCFLGAIISGYYALNTEKIYKSSVIFKMADYENEKGGIPEQFSSLVGFGKLPVDRNNTGRFLQEKIKGRIFIEKIDELLDLKNDTFFNSYDGRKVIDPFWKAIIKRLINYESVNLNINEIIWQGIVKKFNGNITTDIMEAGIIRIDVSHKNALRASIIANTISEIILSENYNDYKKGLDNQSEYLTNALANALNELEVSQEKLKVFAIKNSALPLENFSVGSIKLDSLRDQLDYTIQLFHAAAELEKIMLKKTINTNDYIYLKNKFPIVDQIEFRRILGQSEITSSWSWPKMTSVKAVLETLLERKKRLQSEIEISEKEAEQSSKALEVYAELKRNEKSSEATYAVLIEQVKAQSMSAGYLPNDTYIFEYASPSINPSSPNTKLYLVIGFTLGFFLGALLSIVISIINKIYYSKTLLINDAKARFSINAKSLIFLKKKSLNIMQELVLKKSQTCLRNIAVEIHNQKCKFVIVSSLGARFKSNDLAKIISSYIQKDNIEIAIINFSSKNKVSKDNSKAEVFGKFRSCEKVNKITILEPNNDFIPADFIGKRSFSEDLYSLGGMFDLIFVCADNNECVSLTRAIQFQDIFHILSARVKSTKREKLYELLAIKPIQGLVYA